MMEYSGKNVMTSLTQMGNMLLVRDALAVGRGIRQSALSVSYTHLDVYKRQASDGNGTSGSYESVRGR